EAIYLGERMPGRTALERAGIAPVRLQAKEGLALLNGTQALTAVGALALWRATRLAGLADVSGAMTLAALLGTPAAFDLILNRIRQTPAGYRWPIRFRFRRCWRRSVGRRVPRRALAAYSAGCRQIGRASCRERG